MKKMKIGVVLDDGAYMPEKAHTADAGYDIRTPQSFTLSGNGVVTIDTGVHVQIPEGYVGMLKSKSGLNVRDGITCEGVIDSGYTGSIVAKLRKDNGGWKDFQRGDKITQLVILPIANVEMQLIESMEETERGDGGFGSTGR